MIRFGPSGNSQKFYDDGCKSSLEAPAWLNKMGLNAYEYSFSLGQFLSDEKAKQLCEEAKKYNIKKAGAHLLPLCMHIKPRKILLPNLATIF